MWAAVVRGRREGYSAMLGEDGSANGSRDAPWARYSNKSTRIAADGATEEMLINGDESRLPSFPTDRVMAAA